jgi:thioredoxin reductase
MARPKGLDTLVIEPLAPGGQAGTSSKIENYLGFPTGISGQALAGRAQVQAQKFGARLAISRKAASIDCDRSPFCVELEDGQRISTRSIVIATGARYRKLDLPNYDKFEGQGIHYAATWIEGNLCSNEEVIVVGGGNSAGQAAVFLSQQARHVHIMVRGEGLAATMSDYLIQRIDASPKISLHSHTEITALEGDRVLQRVTWTNRASGESETRNIANVFVMIGAIPNTDWLDGCVPLDRGGFVVTGRDGDGMALPSPYATERTGIFAVGDVRSGSTKRVASGVGEGSVVGLGGPHLPRRHREGCNDQILPEQGGIIPVFPSAAGAGRRFSPRASCMKKLLERPDLLDRAQAEAADGGRGAAGCRTAGSASPSQRRRSACRARASVRSGRASCASPRSRPRRAPSTSTWVSAAASRKPRLSPCPAIGWMPCAASPASASRSAVIVAAWWKPSGSSPAARPSGSAPGSRPCAFRVQPPLRGPADPGSAAPSRAGTDQTIAERLPRRPGRSIGRNANGPVG